MKRRIGLASAVLGGALALTGTAVVVPAMASPDTSHSSSVTQQSQSQQADRGNNSGQSARAAEPGNGFFTADGVQIRKGPSTNRVSLGAGYKGQRIQVHCDRAGNGSWWNITNLATGVRGYVYWPDNVLRDFGTPDPPNC